MKLLRRIGAAAATWPVKHVANTATLRTTPFPPTLAPTMADSIAAFESITAWPEYKARTPLLSASPLAASLGLSELWLKDESDRLGTGSFKALGGGYAVEKLSGGSGGGSTIATASAGNHGVGVAWACRRLGAACHVFLSASVSEFQADRIRALGGTVHRTAGNYEDSLRQAREHAERNEWQIVQDVSWEGYTSVPRSIFAGYTVLAAEMAEQLASRGALPPTHVFVNAGVGGLAAAVCAYNWQRYSAEERPTFITCEPTCADALLHSASAGGLTSGKALPLPAERIAAEESTIMTGLDCKVPDALAWEVLSRGVDHFVAVSDEVVEPCVSLLKDEAMVAPPIHAGDSAVAGLGVLVAAASQPALREKLGLGPDSRVAIIICEGAFTAGATLEE